MPAKCPKTATDFVRRTPLYASYDAQLLQYTRFFAAASIINAVLAKVVAVVPARHLPRCFGFLTEVGAALEITNRDYASTLARGVSGSGLDRALVYAEQDQLQRYVQAQQAERPHQWIAIRNELNGFLNERCAASIVCRWWAGSCSFGRVLRDVREHVGMEIDFAVEWHRVSIGMTLIDHIRRANTLGRNPQVA